MKIFALNLCLDWGILESEKQGSQAVLVDGNWLREHKDRPAGTVFPSMILLQNRPDWVQALYHLQMQPSWQAINGTLRLRFSTEMELNQFFYEFRQHFRERVAAGGLVLNEKQELLGILAREHWTFPKGHLEKGESPADAAVREVKEETGLKQIALGKKIGPRYHTFVKAGKGQFKTTHWFEVTADSSQKLIPQAEEGIQEVAWKSQADWRKIQTQLYALDQQLITAVFPDLGTRE